MRFRPILFNTEMIKAILEGRKTQTRRLIKCNDGSRFEPGRALFEKYGNKKAAKEPPCDTNDILWVREKWQHAYSFDDSDQAIEGTGRYIYCADDPMPFDYWVDANTGEHKEQMPWKPSIHMPKEAARIFLRVKDVRVERLHDMDEEAAVAEGFADSPAETESPLQRFTELWDKTIKREDLRDFGYHANPCVWVIEFERCEKPEGWRRT